MSSDARSYHVIERSVPTLVLRPTPDLGQYRVPGVERLYLVGPFQYPGGGVFGAGRATAQVMCGDLGLDFERLGDPA